MTEQPDDKSRLRRLVLPVVILLLLVGGWFGYLSLRARAKREKAEAELHEAIAEADRLDPGWRLEELEARRAQPADADNGALCVRRARALLPAQWPDPDGQTLQQSLSVVPRNHMAATSSSFSGRCRSAPQRGSTRSAAIDCTPASMRCC
jgi:hypothetical protein